MMRGASWGKWMRPSVSIWRSLSRSDRVPPLPHSSWGVRRFRSCRSRRGSLSPKGGRRLEVSRWSRGPRVAARASIRPVVPSSRNRPRE
eukprot:10142009-Alexandrium_andersonii.AAC.1